MRMVWTIEEVPHPWIVTMHAPSFGEREKRDLGTASQRRQNTQAAKVDRAATWENQVGKPPS
jgi:hypothetical protein